METTKTYIRALITTRGELAWADPDRVLPSWVHLSTITMVSKFEKPLNLEALKEMFVRRKVISIKNKGAAEKSAEWKLEDTAFHNQMTISFRNNHSIRSVKLFPNGSIQVAGCKDFIDCEYILNQIAFLVKVILKEDNPVGPPVVSMINSNFSINSTINQRMVIQKLSADPKFKVSFNPEKYAGVIVKFVPGKGEKRVTASVFGSGKVIVTGAKTLSEISDAYATLTSLLTKELMVKPAPTKETFGTFMGATFEEWGKII